MEKLKKVFLICLFLFPFFIYSSSFANSSFYPMAVGNEWEFNSDFDPHSDVIGYTSRVNGILYYGFGRSMDEREYWLREEDSKVYCLNTPDSTEFVLYDFTIEVGDSIELPVGYGCSFGGKIFLIGKNDTVITPAGTFYNCYHFKHRPNCMDAGIMDTWFAKGVGKVRYDAVYIFGLQKFLLNDYSIITSIDVNSNVKMLNSFQLYQNYPNPFNPDTKISYSIPTNGFVKLRIYDYLGKEITTLVNKYQSAGNYKVQFDGSDLATGVYISTLRFGDSFKSKKMIMIN